MDNASPVVISYIRVPIFGYLPSYVAIEILDEICQLIDRYHMLVCPILGPQDITPWPPIGSRQQLKRFRQLPRGQSVDLSITCPLCSNEKNQDLKMTAIMSNILDRSLARSHRKKVDNYLRDVTTGKLDNKEKGSWTDLDLNLLESVLQDLSNTIVIRDRATALSPQAIFDASCIRDTPQEKPCQSQSTQKRKESFKD